MNPLTVALTVLIYGMGGHSLDVVEVPLHNLKDIKGNIHLSCNQCEF